MIVEDRIDFCKLGLAIILLFLFLSPSCSATGKQIWGRFLLRECKTNTCSVYYGNEQQNIGWYGPADARFFYRSTSAIQGLIKSETTQRPKRKGCCMPHITSYGGCAALYDSVRGPCPQLKRRAHFIMYIWILWWRIFLVRLRQ